ncbi:MAG: M20 family metallopeptidase [Actinomycetota bacterium]|nr:M20 family metallopeptidase [Acidimicrobiia bacterium]MDQ3294311.1 M20 family metallopeptidase [Actinomycetota bacterium]
MPDTPSPSGGSALDGAKARVAAHVDRKAGLLVDASHEIWDHPELNYEEHFAHELLTGILQDEGVTVERSAYDLDTAFVARAGTSGPTIAVLCEYDALPEIGHACGHNVIATAGLGAGLAAAAMADELGGRVVIMGTPAEEGGGGKVLLAERGAFDGVDAAMMVHPAGLDLARMDVIAIHQLHADYHGEAAHAAAFPHKGRNALDAAVLGYNAVAALRQHIRPDERIHGVFPHAGDKPNIVPKYAQAHWYVRSPSLRSLEVLKPRVVACLEAGALAAGCRCEIEWLDPAYADLLDNGPMVSRYIANAAATGRTVGDPRGAAFPVVGSTDMGNVSYLVPSIHPMIAVGPPHVSIHTPEFAGFARGDAGDRAVVDGAKAMAMTVVDLWADAGLLPAAREAHAADLERVGGTAGVPGVS